MKGLISTNEGGPKVIERAFDRPIAGPTTADLNVDLTPKELTPIKFCVRHAIDAEWIEFKKIIEARMKTEPKEIWWRCDKCGFAMPREYRARPGGSCLKCNFHSIEGGGMMRPMTEKEVKAHVEAEAKKDAVWREREERAAFEARNTDRKKHGLLALSMDEFRAERKASWDARRAEDRDFRARETARGKAA